MPELYKSEVSNVLKVYYSAFSSIIGTKKLNSKTKSIIKRRKEVLSIIKELHKKKESDCLDTYYTRIAKLKDKYKVRVVTTNYTNVAKDVISLGDNSISYIHGNLELFENIKTKEIKRIDKFKASDTIFPYLIVPSGIKPIFSPYQIKEYSKALNFINTSEDVYIIGLGLNSDDEHIISMIRERLNKKKNNKVYYFIHENFEINKSRLEAIFNSKNIEYLETCEFENKIQALLIDNKS